jgi:hypothetical protein
MQVVSPEFVGAKAECLNFLIDYTDACLAAQQAEKTQARADMQALANPLDPGAGDEGEGF